MGIRLHTAPPLPGPVPYTQYMDDIFYGRNSEIDWLEDRVADRQQFTAFLAESGAGKTSLLRAGLVPRLVRGRLYEMQIIQRAAEPSESGSAAKLPSRALPLVLREWSVAGKGTVTFAQKLEHALSCALTELAQYVEYVGLSNPGTTLAEAAEEQKAALRKVEQALPGQFQTLRNDRSAKSGSLLGQKLVEVTECLGSVVLILDQFEEPLKPLEHQDAILQFSKAIHGFGGYRVIQVASMRKDKEHLLAPFKTDKKLASGGQRLFYLNRFDNKQAREVVSELFDYWGVECEPGVLNRVFEILGMELPTGRANMLGLNACLLGLYEEALGIGVTDGSERAPSTGLQTAVASSADGRVLTISEDHLDAYLDTLQDGTDILGRWIEESMALPAESAGQPVTLYLRPRDLHSTYAIDRWRGDESEDSAMRLGTALRSLRYVDCPPAVGTFYMYRAVSEDEATQEDRAGQPCRVAPPKAKIRAGAAEVSRVVASFAERLSIGDDEKVPVQAAALAMDAYQDGMNQFKRRLPNELKGREEAAFIDGAKNALAAALQRLDDRNILRQSGDLYELTHDQLARPLKDWAERHRATPGFFFDWPLPLFAQHVFLGDDVCAALGEKGKREVSRKIWRWCAIEGFVLASDDPDDPLVFSECDLRESVFRDCTLRNVHFEKCDLDSCWWLDCTLENVEFKNCSLQRAGFDLASGSITPSDSRHPASMRGVHFRNDTPGINPKDDQRESDAYGLEIFWHGCAGEASDLTFTGLTMSLSEFSGLNLTGPLTFTNCSLSGSSFRQLDLGGEGGGSLTFDSCWDRTGLDGLVLDRVSSCPLKNANGTALAIRNCSFKGGIILSCRIHSLEVRDSDAMSLLITRESVEGLQRLSSEIGGREQEDVRFLGNDLSGTVFGAVTVTGRTEFAPSERRNCILHRLFFDKGFSAEAEMLIVDERCEVALCEAVDELRIMATSFFDLEGRG